MVKRTEKTLLQDCWGRDVLHIRIVDYSKKYPFGRKILSTKRIIAPGQKKGRLI